MRQWTFRPDGARGAGVGGCGGRGIVEHAAKPSACVVAMEACCGAHHLGRLLAVQGHEVRADVAGVCSVPIQGAEERRPRR